MSVLYQDSYQRTLAMLGHPDTDYPSLELCHEWALIVVDTLAKEIVNSGRPTLIDSFEISVSSSETTKSIPRDDFEMLFNAYDTTTNRPIDVINPANAERWGVAGGPNGAGGSILALGWRGSGDDKRLVIYPPGASGTLLVQYLKQTDDAAGPAATIQLLDGFERVLVPAGTALYGWFAWKWSNRSEEMQDRMRSALMDPRNPMSLVNVFEAQKKLFLERIYNPFVVHASNRATSPHARHQRMRNLNPWG